MGLLQLLKEILTEKDDTKQHFWRDDNNRVVFSLDGKDWHLYDPESREMRKIKRPKKIPRISNKK
mgnify:CR=1 FL=1